MRKLLVISYYNDFPVRPTIWDALYSLERYSDCRCFYLNLATQDVDSRLLSCGSNFDAVIYHTSFLSTRWNRSLFLEQVERIRPLKALDALQVAIPQDEFIHTDLLCDFINEFKVKLVYSLFKKSEWPKIYPSLDLSEIEFHQVLAGYLEEKYIKKFIGLSKKQDRPIDIGYRAWHAAYWLGRHGQKKVEIADRFQEAAKESSLSIDVSTRPEDTLVGDDWFRFLLSSKCSLGVEGGSSIIDVDGSIKRRTEAYVQDHPKATFEETERKCFPGLDHSLDASVITPRNFEFCLTDTCQILLEGEYNGILQPGIHYIEIKKDYSNLDEVFVMAQDSDLRKRLIDRCHQDIVLSKKYSYSAFASKIIGDITRLRPAKNASKLSTFLYYKAQLSNHCSWKKIPYRQQRDQLIGTVKSQLKRLLFRNYTPPSSAENTLVSISCSSIAPDTRFAKIADSFSYFDYRSIAIENMPSANRQAQGSFEVITLNNSPCSVPLKGVRGFCTYLKKNLHENRDLYRNHLPDAKAYYLHNSYYFPAVYIKAKKNGAKILYDAHECHSDLLETDPLKSQLPSKLKSALEGFCIKRSQAVLTSCDEFAEKYLCAVSCAPIVLRNWHHARTEEASTPSLRKLLVQKSGLAEDTFIALIIGPCRPGSNMTALLEALLSLPKDIHIACLGSGYEEIFYENQTLYTPNEHRVHTIPPIPSEQVVSFIKDADLGLILNESDSRHGFIAFSQAFSAGLPILYPSLPEINRFAEQYQLGIQVDPRSPQALKREILELHKNKEKREQYRKSANAAFQELNWENEVQVLKSLLSS